MTMPGKISRAMDGKVSSATAALSMDIHRLQARVGVFSRADSLTLAHDHRPLLALPFLPSHQGQIMGSTITGIMLRRPRPEVSCFVFELLTRLLANVDPCCSFPFSLSSRSRPAPFGSVGPSRFSLGTTTASSGLRSLQPTPAPLQARDPNHIRTPGTAFSYREPSGRTLASGADIRPSTGNMSMTLSANGKIIPTFRGPSRAGMLGGQGRG